MAFFEYVREVVGEVRTYGGKMVKTGDVVEFDGWFAEKAANNPNFAPAAVVKADPPGDIEATGERSIDDLKAELDRAGVTADGRWGRERLEREVEAIGNAG